ncbi:uncharacterized protein LOC125647289 [Ostrea edulis]|uniref:uncharacterized protein LOC125647289 n=1 Tax=Ostrea edulis TaxID=37623 RepID=UPI0024AEFA26|nr:uncharacterized protein LOC125647289 [Ostrea edulis]
MIRHYYCLLHFILLYNVATAVHIKVRIDKEDGKPVEYFEEDLTEADFKNDHPPFEMVDRSKRASYDDRPPVPQTRPKRDIFDTDLEVRRKPECDQRMAQIVNENKKKPVQLAYVVEPGENLKLMCHYCGSSENYRGIIQWKRLVRQSTASGEFLVETVEEDNHDIPALNRVLFTSDWSLVILNLTTADSDTYFCIDASKDQVIKDTMDAAGMKEMFTADMTKEKFRLYYHLDIVRTSDIPARKVTETDRFLEPENDMTLNLRFYSDWKEWSSCSVCGKPGERRRRGVCTVQLINNEQYTEPAYVYYALGTFKRGVPCRSTMFDVYGDQFTKRPDEIAIEECHMKCGSKIGSVKFSRLNSADIHFHGVDKGVPVENMNVMEGGSKIIKCKGATLDDIVYWLNNSNYMMSFSVAKNTSGRVTIDVYGNLMITNAQMTDSGLFECWIRMKKIRVVQFTVTTSDPDAWKRHLKYVLFSYFINFCVFLALILVKHWHRQVQSSPVYNNHIHMEDEGETDNYYVEEKEQNSNLNAFHRCESHAGFDETVVLDDLYVVRNGHSSNVNVYYQNEDSNGVGELPTPGGDGNTFLPRRR